MGKAKKLRVLEQNEKGETGKEREGGVKMSSGITEHLKTFEFYSM